MEHNKKQKIKKVELFWDDVFKHKEAAYPKNKSTGHKELDEILDRLIKPKDEVLDFGCGNGSMLIYSKLRGASKLTGVDFSEEAIRLCEKRTAHKRGFKFIQGNERYLRSFKDQSFDKIILSNIIDNMGYPETFYTLTLAIMLLKPNGLIWIKLNDYIDPKLYESYGIKVIKESLVDDGLLLLNETTEVWKEWLSSFGDIIDYRKIYYPEQDTYNRSFIIKRKMDEIE